jgi:phospholipid transport system substrate-binding protein
MEKEDFMTRIIPVFFFLLMAIPSLAFGEQPLDQLQRHIEQALAILKDPKYHNPSEKELQRSKIWEIIQDIFDLEEISKRTLANNWKRLTPSEKKEFVDVFGEFLGDNYIRKIQSGFKKEKVVYLEQEMLTDSKALIKTNIIRETTEIPVNYSMLKERDTWKVYDVVIEGVSLVANYRSQFSGILMKESPARLIEMIKEKIKQQKEEGSAK